ncbi:hypothetical protein GGR56DRAFT_590267 [Xylariaceae sp. FL0804]|nr:hypothetical protein GGR56DRAFT_590267 [Xylariaceae sp. FL0804]
MADADDGSARTAAAATGGETPPMRCCCGSPACVYLTHNSRLLDNVEKDVHTAARMGQALLARHEAYMADAERDRSELMGRIEQLETEKKQLEAKNARTIEENRSLLDQLEALNTTVNDSDGRIKSLEATLLSSQQTIRQLEGETARAAALERQLMALEQEQSELQNSLILTREDARSSMSRWKRAERGINDLQEQLERIEKESREEREHHIEMMSRIEKQREMEKELNTAAGRLKGAAAAKSLHGNGSNVVGHFVRDLLQDNANLQHGIAELREMLLNSNDEIQSLREQLMYHQPLGDGERSATPTLRAELEPKEPPGAPAPDDSRKVSQELHIHHHYHVSTSKQEVKRPRKKRLGLTPGVFMAPAASLPSTPPNGPIRQHSDSHIGKDSLPTNRWSVYSEQPSEFAPSSVPSSPLSNNRNSMFDPIADSFPGSPTTSIDPMSPSWRPVHRKQPSNISARSFQLPASFSLTPATPTRAQPIIEETGDDAEMLLEPTNSSTTDYSADDASSRGRLDLIREDTSSSVGLDTEADTEADTDSSDGALPPVGRLRRTQSHESIMSLSGGLDIHTLRSRPSQLTLRQIGSAAASSVTASSMVTVTASPMLVTRGSGGAGAKRSSAMLRERYYGGAASSSPPLRTSGAGGARSVSNPAGAGAGAGSSKLGKLVGWRPWGGGGGAGGGGGGTTSGTTGGTDGGTGDGGGGGAGGLGASLREKDSATNRYLGRSPGINQPGAIPGFSEYLSAAQKRGPPSKTRPDVVDQEALREGLGE